jgi:hypothetical protein
MLVELELAFLHKIILSPQTHHLTVFRLAIENKLTRPTFPLLLEILLFHIFFMSNDIVSSPII